MSCAICHVKMSAKEEKKWNWCVKCRTKHDSDKSDNEYQEELEYQNQSEQFQKDNPNGW